MRRAEFAASCKLLKVSQYEVLDYPDGKLNRTDLYQVVGDLTQRVRQTRPHVVLTFGPDGGFTGHVDHAMAGVFATMAFECKPAGSNHHGISHAHIPSRPFRQGGHRITGKSPYFQRPDGSHPGDPIVSFTLQPDANGILPDRMIAAMADAGLILPAYPFIESQIQPASLDLRLGDIAYRVRASFLPGPGATVAERIDELKLHEIDLTDGAVLETNCVYIVPLLESLALPPEIVAAANPKSSTGRLDVFTRVIADGTRRFDMIGAGYHGPLYAEISPKTFPVLLREGSRLSQVRFRTGDAILTADELDALHDLERLVDADDADLVNGVALSVDLSGENSSGFVGYRAKRHTGVIDIDRRGGYAVDEFWEAISARPDGRDRKS